MRGLARAFFVKRTPMKIVFDHPATARMSFQAGDELTVQALTPELHTLLSSTRLDGEKVAHVITDDEGEVATAPAVGETATTGRGRRDQRAAAVSR
jgi:hypothetical protein